MEVIKTPKVRVIVLSIATSSLFSSFFLAKFISGVLLNAVGETDQMTRFSEVDKFFVESSSSVR